MLEQAESLVLDVAYALGFVLGAVGPFVLALAVVFFVGRWVWRKIIGAPPPDSPH